MAEQPGQAKRLLLISNSTLYGSGYLDHAEVEIRDFLRDTKRVLFVPFALHDRAGYAAQARQRFELMGFELDSLHDAEEKKSAVAGAEAIFIGGGNTFRLLQSLYETEVLDLIKSRAETGMPYMGSSAGAVVAAPTIKTTNDMPIVEPPSFNSLNLVSFQINAHYLDPDLSSTHMGETREVRLIQFLEDNDVVVVGLREGCMVRVTHGVHTLKGRTNARIFRRGREPEELEPGTTLDHLLASAG